MVDSSLRHLMQSAHDADCAFKKALATIANKEDPRVKDARATFFEMHNQLWNRKLDPLQQRFSEDPRGTVDGVIDFLEIDIPAFRCGYLKEHFLQKLKAVELDATQKWRLKQATIDLCARMNFRRELRYWSRLMIKLADIDFIAELQEIARHSAGRKFNAAQHVLDTVLENRKDLR